MRSRIVAVVPTREGCAMLINQHRAQCRELSGPLHDKDDGLMRWLEGVHDLLSIDVRLIDGDLRVTCVGCLGSRHLRIAECGP